MSRFLRGLKFKQTPSKTSLHELGLRTDTFQPFYQNKPPWWAQWTVAFLACDFFLTANAMDLTWNRWTDSVQVPVEPALGPKIFKGPPSELEPVKTVEAFVPKPAWQRACMCAFHYFAGCAFAVALLAAQSRVVKSITVLRLPYQRVPASVRNMTKSKGPSPPEASYVFIQAAGNSSTGKGKGKLFPLCECTLDLGDKDMALRVGGELSTWQMSLVGGFLYPDHAQKAEAIVAETRNDQLVKSPPRKKISSTFWQQAPADSVQAIQRSVPVGLEAARAAMLSNWTSHSGQVNHVMSLETQKALSRGSTKKK